MLIGLIGYERTGKDTVADYFVENMCYTKMSMADPIKEICKLLFDWDKIFLESNMKDKIDKNTNIVPRDMMKWIGTDIFQYSIYDKFPNLNIPQKKIWVNYIKNNCQDIENLIIPDIRFKHEAEFIQENNGILVYIDRVELKEQYDIMEILQKYPHYNIKNKGTIDELHQNINKFIRLVFQN